MIGVLLLTHTHTLYTCLSVHYISTPCICICAPVHTCMHGWMDGCVDAWVHADRLAHMPARTRPARAWTGFHRPVEEEERLAPAAAAWDLMQRKA